MGAALAAIVLAAGPAAAAPSAAAPSAAAPVCRIDDERLIEISGLVADGSGYVVVNDGADDADGRRIFFLNRRCAVARAVAFPSRPRDTEDLARGPDGTLWVGDVGDNGGSRETVALWRLKPGAGAPRLYRMSYPDGAHDAEALVVSGDGTPMVVTKDPMTAGIYVPEGNLRAGKTTPMRKAGEFAIPVTGTSNPFGLPGRLVITGGATSADGRRVVLRTYADAFEFDVSGGDVVRAITEGEPRVIALPDEPQGEAIAYSGDGTALLTVSEGSDPEMIRYPIPGRTAAPSPPASLAPASSPPVPQPVAAAGGTTVPWGALVLGAAFAAAAGFLGIVVARRRRSR
ncbi:hypothetical protein [Actinoplanes aureus]|uniref:Esterase-like activity of phytase family protein n=1 Tax=Actinoplanes aureus TaxID=2792083 RepID=A0A931FZD5_9ACTN|nr:hypothetical protein [Actinoplanes aureus]MBG0564660.1 hypothetical protein [Actinoplanes aureus]